MKFGRIIIFTVALVIFVPSAYAMQTPDCNSGERYEVNGYPTDDGISADCKADNTISQSTEDTNRSDTTFLSSLRPGPGCFIILGGGVAGYCSHGSCQTIAVIGTTPASNSSCMSNGCMVAGGGVAGYCTYGSCQTINVVGTTPASNVWCAADGCMVAGNGVSGYCSKGSCQTIDVVGATPASTVKCGTDGCMVAGSGVAGYCNKGSCQTIDVVGITPASIISSFRELPFY